MTISTSGTGSRTRFEVGDERCILIDELTSKVMSLPAAYIARKLLEKLPLQLDQTRDLAALTIAAGPERALRWAQMDRQTEAITPATYATWKRTPRPSVYVLNQGLGQCLT